VRADPDGAWTFVSDNLNTHVSEGLVRWVAERCDVTEDLGIKGKVGILKSMASRKEFLSDLTHRIRFVYVPKHSSWLNQIEIVFGILHRKCLQGGSFTSVAALESRIRNFIDYY